MSEMSEVSQKLEEIQQKCNRLRKQLAQAERQEEALQITLDLLSPKKGAATRRARREELTISADELHGMDIETALVTIAQCSDGEIRSHQVRPLLVEAGVLKGQQASNRLWVVLSNSELFESVGRGRYRLAEVKDDSLVSPPWLESATG